MTPLADPRRCPSCRSLLPAGQLVCPICRLDLRGEPGQQLFALLVQADALIARMRSGQVRPGQVATEPAGVGRTRPWPATPAGPAAAAVTSPAATATPTASMPSGSSAGGGVGLATVPKVLLGLGALCVLVAASLFLPFAWDLLGVVGRTVVLVLMTLAAGAVALVAGRRDLRATAEAMGLVMLGLLAFDVLGARSSGWLGDISGPWFTVLQGVVLLVAGTASTLWLRRTPVGAFVGGEVVAVGGSLLLVVGGVAVDAGTDGARLAVLVPLLGAAATGSLLLRGPRPGLASMSLAAAGHGLLTALTWLALLATGASQLADDGLSWSAMWPTGAGLLLLLAGLYAAVPAVLPRTDTRLRAAGLAVALLPWALALTAPAYDEGPSWRTLAALLPLVVGLVAARLVPPPWHLAVVPLAATSAVASTALVAPLAVTALTTGVESVSPAWSGAPTGEFVPSWDTSGFGSPWLLPLVVVVVGVALLLGAREPGTRPRADVADAPESPRTGAARGLVALAVLGATLTLLALCGAMVLAGAPVWSVLAVLLAGGLAAGAGAWPGQLPEWHAAELVLGVTALVVSAYDEWLTLGCCLALLVVAGAHHGHGRAAVRMVAGAAAPLLLTGAIWAGGALLGARGVWTGLVALLVVGAIVIVRGLLDDPTGTAGVEAGGVLAGLAAFAAGLDHAPSGQESMWLAVYLTVAGAATTVVALTRPERRTAGWGGGLLLAAASWVRLSDVGVSAPEAYTLPSALALLVTGWYRTRRDPGLGTLTAWSPGLGLALVPSLLWAVADPLSWRALLLGAAALGLVLLGAQLRLAAPLVWGAGVGAVLALWEVLPPAFEMSAWLVMGVVGAGLLLLGASWERRVQDARTAVGYVRNLR